jgi:hypothetical protein
MIKRDSANQSNPVVVVTPGSKAALFLKPSDRVVGGQVKSITNSGSAKLVDIEFKFPAGSEDGEGESGKKPEDPKEGSDKPDPSDVEFILPPVEKIVNGVQLWEYTVYVKNTSKVPQSVKWVDSQIGEE